MGFTGLNPSITIQELRTFREAMLDVANIFEQGGRVLFETLQNSWFSPRAMEFASKYSGTLYETTVTTVEVNADRIEDAVINAFNSMSAANGGSTITPQNRVYPSIQKTFGQLREYGPSGEMGMDSDIVNSAVIGYEATVRTGLNALNSLPLSLDLYDNNGQLRASYNQVINTVRQLISEITSDMVNSLKRYVNEEQTIVENAVSQSVEALESGVGTIDTYIPGQGSTGGYGSGTGANIMGAYTSNGGNTYQTTLNNSNNTSNSNDNSSTLGHLARGLSPVGSVIYDLATGNEVQNPLPDVVKVLAPGASFLHDIVNNNK